MSVLRLRSVQVRLASRREAEGSTVNTKMFAVLNARQFI